MIAGQREPASTPTRTGELRLQHDFDGAAAFCVYQAIIANQACVEKLLVAI